MRGRVIQQLRLRSGVVLFAYVTGHPVNRTFGLASMEAMEAGRRVYPIADGGGIPLPA